MYVGIAIALSVILLAVIAVVLRRSDSEAVRRSAVAAVALGVAIIGASNIIVGRSFTASVIMIVLGLAAAIPSGIRAFKTQPLPERWYVLPALLVLASIAIAAAQIFYAS